MIKPEYANAVLETLLDNTDYPHPYKSVALCDSEPTFEGNEGEIEGGGYESQSLRIEEPVDGVAVSEDDLVFDDLPDVEVTHIAIKTGDDIIWFKELETPLDFNDGDIYTIPKGDLEFLFDKLF